MSQASFRYWALDQRGAPSRGVVRAANERDAYRRVAAQGLTPTRIRAAGSARSGRGGRGRVPAAAIANFTYQFSVLLEARIPVVECLTSIAEQEENVRLKSVAMSMASSVQSGSTITQAFEGHARVFGSVYVETVRAAEQSGNTISVLGHLAEDVEAGMELRRTLRGAVTYPIIVVVALFSAVMFLVTFVIPRFATLFAQRGVDLPLLTEVLVAFGSSVRGYWWAYLGALAAVILGLRAAWSRPRGREVLDAALNRVPHLRSILCGLAASRFAGVLGIALSSGIGLIDGLEMSGRASGRPLLRRDAQALIDQVRRGGRLGEALRSCGYMPAFARQLIRAGEESGDLPRMCRIVSRHYARETMHLAKSTATVLEPVLIAGLTGVVLMVALAVFLPMWDMVSIME